MSAQVLTHFLRGVSGRRAGLLAAAAVTAVTGVAGLAGSAPQAAAAPSDGSSGLRHGVVIARGGLTARVAATVHSSAEGSYRHGARLTIDCKVHGTDVAGNTLWYGVVVNHDQRLWVSARYVANDGPAPEFCNPDGFFRGRTTATLNQRSGPSTADRLTGRYSNGARVNVACFLGPAGNRWFYTDRGRWVNARYVSVNPDVAFCANH